MNFSKASIRAELFSKNPNYKGYVRGIKNACESKDEKAVQHYLDKLPSDEQLFENLVKKLEGKSVHTNILKLVEGKTSNKYESIKVYSSLLTHCAIQCEKEPEYEVLFESILQKIYESLGE